MFRLPTVLLLLVLSLLPPAAHAASPRLQMPQQGLAPSDLAVVINDNDPLSVAVGELYARERDIPASQVVRLRFPAEITALPEGEFRRLKRELDKSLPSSVQGLLLTWVKPYRVECMSITSAFSLGFDRKYCARRLPGKPCGPTAPSAYFNSTERRPYDSLGIRPSMVLGASTLQEAQALIRRGLDSEEGEGRGSAYLLSTSDKARNVRAAGYPQARELAGRWLPVRTPVSDSLRGKDDVLFYFTGRERVDSISSNRFRPGAVADHLTSFGGMLTDSRQMSALAWIKAGATGSYGTVVEPCAFPQKFPDPTVMMLHYLAGERLLEAYWKSVLWPGEGIFVGDPLARPFPGYFLRRAQGRVFFDLPYLAQGSYVLEAADAAFGPFRPLGRLVSRGQSLQLPLRQPVAAFYRLRPTGG